MLMIPGKIYKTIGTYFVHYIHVTNGTKQFLLEKTYFNNNSLLFFIGWVKVKELNQFQMKFLYGTQIIYSRHKQYLELLKQ